MNRRHITLILVFGVAISFALICETAVSVAQSGSVSTTAPVRPVQLTRGQLAALRELFPNVYVQTAAPVTGPFGRETWALVWEQKPVSENRCPKILISAYDIQSCTGFEHALSGLAHIVRLKSNFIDSLSLTRFFQHDANPSGIEIDGQRGPRLTFLPTHFRFEFLDLNGDGFKNELLIHVSNGPYAYIQYWIAITVKDNKLTPLVGDDGIKPLIGNRDAWLDLARTGHGQSDLYCGVRCAEIYQRWTLDREKQGHITGKWLWTCSPDDPRSWKIGEPQHGCPE